MDVWSALQCVDYWLERYQTLATGMLAFVAAAIALRPAFEQAVIARRQDRLRRYTMLRDVIDIVDPQAWRLAFPTPPTTAELNKMLATPGIWNALLDRYTERKRVWATLCSHARKAVEPEQASIIDDMDAQVNAVFADIDGKMVQFAASMDAAEKQSGVDNRPDNAGMLHTISVEIPDRAIIDQLSAARAKLLLALDRVVKG